MHAMWRSKVFDTGVDADGVGVFGSPSHTVELVCAAKILYSDGVGAAGIGVPQVIHLALSGISSRAPGIWVKVGVSGIVPWATDARFPAPDAEGFHVAFSVEGGYFFETVQVDWFALWTDAG